MSGFKFRLIPRQERFFEMFQRSAANVDVGARALCELFADYTDVERKVRALKEIEHAGDELTHAIFDAVDRSFVIPLDRDDVTRLAGALDDIVDAMEEAAHRLFAYRIEAPTELARRFAAIIAQQAGCIVRAMPALEDESRAPAVREEIVAIHRLENEADDLLTEALGAVFDGSTTVADVVMAVKWRDVYELLEDATDRAEHVGTALESILVKRG